jgi:hypothetical protein
MKSIFTALLLYLSIVSIAQKTPYKFGDVPQEDLEMTVYDKDSSAVAVILFDFGKAYVNLNNVNSTLNIERHIRIKILKSDGLSWADASIPLFHRGNTEEKVVSLKAVTYTLEGGKVVETKMSKEGIFKERFNRNINLQKFTLPNVKVGSVIEYSYTIMSDFLANFPNWQFQYSIPSRHSEFWAYIPDFFVMEKYMQGYLTANTYEVKDRTMNEYFEKIHHWVVTSCPAFKPEPFITTESDYVSKINFALAYIRFPQAPIQEIMGSWEKLAQELLEAEGFGKTITGSNFLKKQAEAIVLGKQSDREKVEAIHAYVKNNLEWDGQKDFTADNLKDVFERRKGTAGDINLALASLLEKVGLAVDMVLLSTRDHGFIRKNYPMSRQLNYVVCRVLVDNKFVFLDATEKYLPVGVLPERCLNGEGLLVSKTNTGWVELSTKTKAKSVISAEMKMEDDGKLEGTVNYLRNGYDALHMRRQFHEKGEKEYLKDFIAGKAWDLKESAFTEVDSVAKDVREIHNVLLEQHSSLAENVVYLNPFITSQLEVNPFKPENREYPVDYGCPQEKTYTLKLSLPDTYVVDELPKSKVIALPGNTGRYTYSATQMGNVISVTSSLQINKSLFIQGEYPQLREFYNQVVAKQAEQIVIKRK